MRISEDVLKNSSFILYVLGVAFLVSLLPDPAFNYHSDLFLLSVGSVALWRYGWGLTHFIRSWIYLKYRFPQWRRQADVFPSVNGTSKVYILANFFRIPTEISARVVHSIIQEIQNVNLPAMVVFSIVEAQDEELIADTLANYDLPDHIAIHIIRVNGKGKRYGLAQGLRVISRDMPDENDICVIMDGDTMLTPDCLRKATPFFNSMPEIGALTTDEVAMVGGSDFMRDWYNIRFAQRHLLMSSLSLSKRVMTLTGRMSMFRASIVSSPEFITHMEEDHLEHWRLGRIPFLTGDDKSSLYFLMKEEWAQIYVPDIQVVTMEDAPDNFIVTSTKLMMRWFGNMLRTNARILKLGVEKMPFFVWWSFLDQRLSMWTTFSGPVFACMLSFHYGPVIFLYYFAWVGIVRGVMCLQLLLARPSISWRYPFLLYYNQVYAAFVKIWMLFNLDKQSWTRQKTKLDTAGTILWRDMGTAIVYSASLLFLVTIVGLASSTLFMPNSFIHDLFYSFGLAQ